MAQETITLGTYIPTGTSVSAYPKSNWTSATLPPTGAPVGAATASGTVAANGTVTFTGLAAETEYFAAGQVGGVYKYIRFFTSIPDDSQPGTVANRETRLLVTPKGSTENAIVIKAPDSAWGGSDNLEYGEGQALIYMREQEGGDSTIPDDLVMFRVSRLGGLGLTGGIHVATGLRKRAADPNPLYSIHVQPTLDIAGIIIDPANSSPTASYLQCRNSGGTALLDFKGNGQLQVNAPTPAGGGEIVANSGSATGQVAIGSMFGLPSIMLGTANDCYIHRSATGTMMLNATDAVKVNDAYLEFDEVTEPAAPAADNARLYVKDNGSGKTQLCVRFSSGAVQVIATQP